MTYVGFEGVIAAWYAIHTGCLPEIAFYKAFGEQVPWSLRKEIIMEIEYMDVEDKYRLIGADKKQRYREYRSRAKKSAKEALNEL